MSSSNTEHLATDSVGPSSGHGSSATLHSHHDSNQSTTTTTSGPGHAHSVAQAQGFKLDTAAAGSSSGSTAGRSGSEEGSGSSGAGAGTGGGPMEGSFKRPGGLAENPNARSKTITLAEGENTYGVSVFVFGGVRPWSAVGSVFGELRILIPFLHLPSFTCSFPLLCVQTPRSTPPT